MFYFRCLTYIVTSYLDKSANHTDQSQSQIDIQNGTTPQGEATGTQSFKTPNGKKGKISSLKVVDKLEKEVLRTQCFCCNCTMDNGLTMLLTWLVLYAISNFYGIFSTSMDTTISVELAFLAGFSIIGAILGCQMPTSNTDTRKVEPSLLALAQCSFFFCAAD